MKYIENTWRKLRRGEYLEKNLRGKYLEKNI
jgi:hypothetical protein